MDFDPLTGLSSNAVQFAPFAGTGGYGIEFSPNSSKLYLQTLESPRRIVQYDLLAGEASEILASRFVVDSAGSFPPPNDNPLYGGALQLAPNGIIYANRLHKPFLSAIMEPDALGAACGYIEQAIDLSPLTCQDGLPNHLPSYPPCSAYVDVTEFSDGIESAEVTHSTDRLVIRSQDESWIGMQLILLDMNGRIVLNERIRSSDHSIKLQGIASGSYVARLMNNDVSSSRLIILGY